MPNRKQSKFSPGVGRGAPSRLTWDWLAAVRQDEVIQAHDAPGACLPSQEDLGVDGVGGAPAPRCDPQAGLPPSPLPRIHTRSSSFAGPPALRGASLQGAPPLLWPALLRRWRGPGPPRLPPHDAALASLTRKRCLLWMSTRSRTQEAPSSPWRLRSRTGGWGAAGLPVCRNTWRQPASDPCR